jgi:hypothetical protein
MLNSTDRVPVSLDVQGWNQVLGILQEQPWRIVNPLILGITEQIQAASAAAPVLGNGVDHSAEVQPHD